MVTEAAVCVIGEADPFIGRLLRRFAEKSGLHAVGVQLGQEMLEFIRHTRPAVIVVDPELPGLMRGWEAVRALRSEPGLGDIPIIACSWLNETDARTLTGEVSSYLEKPELHYEDFAAALKQAGVL